MNDRVSLYEQYKNNPKLRKPLLQEDLLNKVQEEMSRLLEMRGLTRAALASRLGVTKGYITQILRGQNISLRKLADIADALECEAQIELVPRELIQYVQVFSHYDMGPTASFEMDVSDIPIDSGIQWNQTEEKVA